jgi:hypothetical protein
MQRDENGLTLGAAIWMVPPIQNPMPRSRLFMSHDTYSHQELDAEKGEIRLLKLDCAVDHGELTGVLKNVQFKNAPPYDALSYTCMFTEMQLIPIRDV